MSTEGSALSVTQAEQLRQVHEALVCTVIRTERLIGDVVVDITDRLVALETSVSAIVGALDTLEDTLVTEIQALSASCQVDAAAVADEHARRLAN